MNLFISNAYSYLDKQRKKYENYDFELEDIKFEQFFPIGGLKDMDLLEFKIKYNNNKTLIGTSSVLGVFNNKQSVWTWAWALPLNFKSENYLSKKILNYAFDIDIKNDSLVIQQSNTIFKAELLNSKIYIQYHNIEIEKYIAIALYLTKSDYYYKETVKNFNVNTQEDEIVSEIYYFLRDISESSVDVAGHSKRLY